MAEFKIIRAVDRDSWPIYLLGKRVHELDFSSKYPFHGLSEIREFISKPSENVLLVAKKENETVGFVYAKILSHHAGGWCMLDNLAVEKRHRNKGIARALLKALYADIKKKKVHYVHILEDQRSRKTRRFWKKQGYRETKTYVWAEKMVE